ncbi:MAG: hypothetical protein H6990_01300 [Pseudomonadales bacterium]|nr:hypothetical protein [Pseudomonadales bacterium]
MNACARLLFEVVKFPTAMVSATVSPDILDAVTAGGAVTTELPVTVTLHGWKNPVDYRAGCQAARRQAARVHSPAGGG